MTRGFNSRARVGATTANSRKSIAVRVSIHAPGWARHSNHTGHRYSTLFQFTRPGGRDSKPASPPSKPKRFQFTRPGGRDVTPALTSTPWIWFQFTRPGGRDTCQGSPVAVAKACFNSRARVGATTKGYSHDNPKNSFNSRARVGATRLAETAGLPTHVSIHAPGWARLAPGLQVRLRQRVSIHAPGWARPVEVSRRRAHRGFNSRARVGATCSAQRRRITSQFQFTRPGGRDTPSPPAPTSPSSFNSRARVGATADGDAAVGGHGGFNSRARVGATSPNHALRPGERRFNSRARVGATRACPAFRRGAARRFNSRARVGATPGPPRRAAAAWRFNSRARVGATHSGHHGQDASRVSIHAPGWARQVLPGDTWRVRTFQFTRPGGRDNIPATTTSHSLVFQFTRPGGRDLIPVAGVGNPLGVSIHAPGWARLDS